MSSFDLTGKKIRNTYQRLIQISGSQLVDGTGSLVDNINVTSSFAITSSYAEYAVSASHEIIKEVSSSFADTASYVNPLDQDVTITGNVGIGTTSPLQPLHVNGNIQQQGTTNSIYMIDGGEIRGTSNLTVRSLGTFVAFQSAGSLFFQANNTERMRIDSATGNIGIGTTSPSSTLQIKGSGTTSATTAFLVQNSAGSDMLVVKDDRSIETYDATGNVITKNNAGNRRFEVNPNRTNLVDLQVGGSDLSNLIRTDSGLNSVGIGRKGLANTRLHVRGSGTTSSTTALLVENLNSSASLVVRDDGNVGIGTTNPTGSLQLLTPSTTTLRVDSTNSFGNGIKLETTGLNQNITSDGGNFSIIGKYTTVWEMDTSLIIPQQYFYGGGVNFRKRGTTDNLIEINLENSASPRMLLKGSGTTDSTTALKVENSNGDDNFIVRDDGNVGIGTGNPQSSLHIYDDSQSGVFLCESSGSVASRDVFKVNSLNLNTDNTKIFTIQKAGVSEFEFRGNGIAVLGLDYANRITTSNPRLSIGDITGQRDVVLGVKTGKSYNSNSPRKITAFYTKLNEEVASFDDHGRLVLQKRGLSAPSDGNPHRLTVSGSTRITEGLIVTGSISSSGDLSIEGFPSVSASLASAGGGGSAFPFTGSAQIQGLGTTSATTALRVENANSDEIVKITDDGALDMPTLSSGSAIGLVKRDGDAFFYRFSYGDNGTTTPLGRNIFIGKNTGNFTVGVTATANYMGSDNIGIGDNSLTDLTHGNRNIAIGQGVGASITTAGSNVMMGWGTGNNLTTGGENFLLGNFTGGSLTTHKGNVMIGTTVGQNIRGFYNVAIGDRALQGSGANQSAGNNIAIGRAALQNIKASSDFNVAIGTQALVNIGGNADGNIAIGYQTGLNNSGSAFDYNILIGYNVQAPLQNTGNQLNIGNLLYGTGVTSDQSVSTAGKIGIGQTTPDAKLHITGEGTTDSTTSLLVENSNGDDILKVTDNGAVSVSPDYNGGGFSVNSTQGIRSDSPSNASVKIVRNNNVGYFAMLSYFDGNSVMWQTGTPKSSDNVDFAGTEYIIAQSSRSSPAITINTSNNVGIGATSPDASAILDIASTSKGVLFPRMTETQRTAISSPATGLIVYQTDATEGLYIYKSTGWVQII